MPAVSEAFQFFSFNRIFEHQFAQNAQGALIGNVPGEAATCLSLVTKRLGVRICHSLKIDKLY